MKKNGTTRFYLSTASFFFWNKVYDPIYSIDLISSLGLHGVCGLDIYIDPNRTEDFQSRLTNSHRDFLRTFVGNCIHTDFWGQKWLEAPDVHEMRNIFSSIAETAEAVGTKDVVIHGDFLNKEAKQRLYLLRDALPDFRISLELMGKDKVFFTHPEHLLYLLELDPSLYFTPDLAHMQDWENEYDWQKIFLDPLIRRRIFLVHVSHHMRNLMGNWYQENGHQECESAIHGLMQCNPENCNSALKTIISNFVIVLEGILPKTDNVQEILNREMQVWSSDF